MYNKNLIYSGNVYNIYPQFFNKGVSGYYEFINANNETYYVPIVDNTYTDGAYSNGAFIFITPNTDLKKYTPENYEEIINFSDVVNYKEYLDKIEIINKYKEDSLVTDYNTDNLTRPMPIKGDSAEMVALKEIIRAKKIDINKYSDRFVSFNNDKRQLLNPKISIDQLKRFCTALDIECEVILRDKPNIPNPAGIEVKFKLDDPPYGSLIGVHKLVPLDEEDNINDEEEYM